MNITLCSEKYGNNFEAFRVQLTLYQMEVEFPEAMRRSTVTKRDIQSGETIASRVTYSIVLHAPVDIT